MAHRVRFSRQAQRDIQGLTDYLTRYSDEVAFHYLGELESAIERNIAEHPNTWQFFVHSGAPFRAHLFKISRHTAHWIVYTVDDESQIVDIVRVWHAAQNPEDFEA